MLNRILIRIPSLFSLGNSHQACRLPLVLSTLNRSLSKMCADKNKTALVLLAPGSEEMEFVISVDVLRRAGVKVTVGGLSGSRPITCSRDVEIVPDLSLKDAIHKGPYDAVVLPGGLAGTLAFCESIDVGNLLQEQEKSGRLVAAICAAPTALKVHKIALGKSITSYPTMKKELQDSYNYKEEKVVEDGNLITSQGPATAFDFALAVAKYLVGKEKVESISKDMLVLPYM